MERNEDLEVRLKVVRVRKYFFFSGRGCESLLKVLLE